VRRIARGGRVGRRDIAVATEESGAALGWVGLVILNWHFVCVAGEERHGVDLWSLADGNGSFGVLVFWIGEFFKDEGE